MRERESTRETDFWCFVLLLFFVCYFCVLVSDRVVFGWIVLHLSLCPSDILPFHPRWPGRLVCADRTGFSRVWLPSGAGRVSEKGRGNLRLFVTLLPTTVPSSIAARPLSLCSSVFLFHPERQQWLPVILMPGAPSFFIDSLSPALPT